MVDAENERIRAVTENMYFVAIHDSTFRNVQVNLWLELVQIHPTHAFNGWIFYIHKYNIWKIVSSSFQGVILEKVETWNFTKPFLLNFSWWKHWSNNGTAFDSLCYISDKWRKRKMCNKIHMLASNKGWNGSMYVWCSEVSFRRNGSIFDEVSWLWLWWGILHEGYSWSFIL